MRRCRAWMDEAASYFPDQWLTAFFLSSETGDPGLSAMSAFFEESALFGLFRLAFALRLGGVALPFLEPLRDLRCELLLALGTDVNPDMSRLQADVLGVFAADMPGQLLAGFRRHKMVVLPVEIEHRHRDIFQIHALAVQFHFALDQQVLLVAVFYELPECGGRDVGAVENPFFPCG